MCRKILNKRDRRIRKEKRWLSNFQVAGLKLEKLPAATDCTQINILRVADHRGALCSQAKLNRL